MAGKNYIYMNHHIRDRENLRSRTPEPVVTVQCGPLRVHCNRVDILDRRGRVVASVRWGRLRAHGHHVHAWVEADRVRVSG